MNINELNQLIKDPWGDDAGHCTAADEVRVKRNAKCQMACQKTCPHKCQNYAKVLQNMYP